jgi:uncharacterized protein YbaP (TraB family)
MSLHQVRGRTASFRLQRLVAILAAGLALLVARPALAEPALWRVHGPHATVYLFGTIHFLRTDTVWHSPRIDAAFASAGTLYEELATVEDASAFATLAARYGRDPDHPLTSRLDEAGRARLLAAARTLQAPIEQLEPLRPWMAAIDLSSLRLIRAGYDPNSGVDVRLTALANAQGKTIAGFETLEQQLRGLACLPEPTQQQFLLSTLDEAQAGAPVLDRVVSAWGAGDVDGLWPLTGERLRLHYPELYARLFADRNRAFASRIEELVRGEGVYFIAIGAAHLAGPDSIQIDLARDGFTVSRM